MSWPETRLADFAEIDPTTPMHRGQEYPYLGMADVPEWSRNATPSETRLFKGSGTRFLAGDTLMARITPCLENGKTCQAGSWAQAGAFGSTEFIVFRARPGVSDSRFIYYLTRSHLVRETAIASMVGASGRQRVQREVLEDLRLPLPQLPTQRRIADILSAYDELIDNNNRRMDLLEESIHLLYRQWFVYLRFPWHERTRIVDGVPEGWVQTAGEHAIAFNPRTPIPKDKVRPYVPMGSISTNSMQIIDIDERVPKGGAKFRNGDTLLARITPCLENGKTGYVQFMATTDEAASGSTEFIVMRGKTMPPSWVYCLARSPDFRQEAINRMSGSDGRQRVDWKALAKVEILVPSEAVAAEFDEVAKGVFDEIRLLSKYNEKLREARDILLPRLMDGRIPV